MRRSTLMEGVRQPMRRRAERGHRRRQLCHPDRLVACWCGMSSKKSGKIAALVAAFRGQPLDARYLGYFECFNRGLYFEAHDVLEELWLADRRGPNGDFYKGLIQLAGAFVHLQKNRPLPAAALFRLARTNLCKYPARHEHFDVTAARTLIEEWLGWLENKGGSGHPATHLPLPSVE